LWRGHQMAIKYGEGRKSAARPLEEKVNVAIWRERRLAKAYR